MNKITIVFFCHIVNDEAIRRYNLIKQGLQQNQTLFWLFNDSGQKIEKEFNDENFININFSNILEKYKNTLCKFQQLPLNYTNPGLSIFQFYQKFPNFDNYLFIEHDCYYTGQWKNILEKINNIQNIDLTTYAYNYPPKSNWMWLLPGKCDLGYFKQIDKKYYATSLNQFVIFSNKFFKFLHQIYTTKNFNILSQFTFITSAQAFNFKVKKLNQLLNNINLKMDIIDKKYTKNINEIPQNTLYHPVKF